MATKLFVGGLDYSITSEELEEAFAAVGTVVSAQVIKDRETDRSKGFGFVEMDSEEDAKKAIEQLNGSLVKGRAIAVSEARPKENRERSFSGGGPRNFGNNRNGGGRRY